MRWQSLSGLHTPIAAMAAVIVLSNVLVQHPINDWLSWGAFSCPLVFLVTAEGPACRLSKQAP